MLLRLTSLEDSSLNCTAEGEEITDAIGALITTLYRAKKATFSASNSLVSLDLAAAQYGAKKQVASETNKVVDYAYEILKIETETTGEGDDAVTTVKPVKLAHAPIVDSIKWIYTIENNEVGTAYPVASAATDTEAMVADDGTITLPTTVTNGKIYVEYKYETEKAVRVVNKASEFPSAVSVVIYAYFRDVCNENKIYSGKIICPKAKLNPESVEMALTSTGKHPFEFVINRDYCAEEGEDTLFEIILSE
jgi:hypothetical protein